MNWKILLTLLAAGLWWWLGDYLYTCKAKQVCYGCGAQSEAITPPPPSTSYAPLTFNFDNSDAITTDAFATVKDSILGGNADDKILEITGYYFQDEDESVGLARAASAAKLLGLPEDKVRLKAEQVSGNGTGKERFSSADFNWVPVKREAVEETLGGATIRFPYNSSIKDADPSIDVYLDRLAEELKKTGKKVTLTGHTDSDGEVDANMRLGRQRARMIRQILRDKGVSRNQITIESRGEAEPVDTNETEDGKHNNRRVEVRIID